MLRQSITPSEFAAIEAEQVKAYFKHVNALNIAGAAVFSLLVFVMHDKTPWWTWAPALCCLYLVTLFRVYLIRQYRLAPERRSIKQWKYSQALTGGMAGVCWGVSNMAMMIFLPKDLQFFVLTVAAVVAATSISEGFLLMLPTSFFITASIAPSALWLLTLGDPLHGVLGLMLLIFIPVTIVFGIKKSYVFIEAQHLRFQNEALVKTLSRQRELLELASNSKSRFLAAASHDLRQPLAALMIFLELLESEQLSPNGKNSLDKAQLATASLRNLLDALLDISKLDAHVVKPVVHSFSIWHLFDEMETEFLPQAEQKGIRLHFANCSAVIESDITLLGQILRNLISNALRYTSSGSILVGCRRRNGMLSIEVHDTGIGIAEDQRTRIFDEFYQVDNHERDMRRGLGLGLSIVDRVARLLGYTVTVHSQLGKGSSFSVLVPLAQGQGQEAVAVQQETSVRAPDVNDIEGRLFAVVENEGSIGIGIQNLLQARGGEVLVADSVDDILRLLERQERKVDMVISDFGLRGDRDGLEAITAIRKIYGGDIAAFLFTGDISKGTYAAAQAAGIRVLYKPATPESLREAITAEFSHTPNLTPA